MTGRASSLKLLVVAGARPNFMKIAPILRAAEARGHASALVHTGQHFDQNMSDAFFRDLELRAPDFHLGIGGGTHAQQTARIMEAFEPVLTSYRPDWLVVAGDVDSTLACSLVAAKLRQALGCRIAHVEAGLRSGDWCMPEEVNRVLTDHLSNLLLLPSRDAFANLEREGIADNRMVFVGNVMIDSLRTLLPRARARRAAGEIGITGKPYALVTLHRPSNVDDPKMLTLIFAALGEIAATLPVVFPLHPRTRRQLDNLRLTETHAGIRILDPLGYLEMLSLLDDATIVLTDSGGVQEESTVLGVPCVTLREQTERPITITEGTNRLAPWPLSREGIASAATDAQRRGRTSPPRIPDGWDGRAAERIIQALADATA